MNSLNIVSRLTTTPPPSPPRSRTGSSGDIENDERRGLDIGSISEKLALKREDDGMKSEGDDGEALKAEDVNEKTPLLDGTDASAFRDAPASRAWSLPARIGHAVVRGVNVVYTTITAPVRYVIACFYDDQGHFSTIMPLRNFKHLLSRRRRRNPAATPGSTSEGEKPQSQRRTSSRRSPSVDSNASSSSIATSDGEDDAQTEDSPARHTRSRTAAAQHQGASSSTDEVAPQKKSIKIKLHPDEALRKRRLAKAQAQQKRAGANPDDVTAVANALKSPSSSSSTTASSNSKLTRYPRAPAPPRPLVPRRQPSYTLSYSPTAPKKTLIIDLDETLIHSMAKGGRMSTGHMVEVRLGGSYSTAPVHQTPLSPADHSLTHATRHPVTLGPGVPILYYVHERPGCHEFLRKVSKWYHLVAFTASVQEYADPVVDWLERERRYFGARYYRQHCTLRNGAYIKDLAQVEPDLSRVMILDNSPMSYIFHEDNAIPIEGWISDPTDHELLHLIPLLEGLQYVTDVRALLALRQGQAAQA